MLGPGPVVRESSTGGEKKGLGALAARNLGSRRLRRWDTRREALCGQAGGPLPREGARGRSMPGQGVGAHHTEQGQVGRDRSRVCVGSTVAMGWTPPKVARGAGKAQKRACAAAAALCAPTIDAQKVGHAGLRRVALNGALCGQE